MTLDPVPTWTHKDLVLVATLTFVAAVLRSIGLNEGLWFDEMMTAIHYVPLPAREIIGSFDSLNNHILYSLFAHLSSVLTGETAWSLRLPAALFGIATIPAAYYLGRQLFSRNEAFLASAFLAVSYHHIWFSQSARGYTGLLLGTVLASILFIRLLALKKPGYRSVFAYATIVALASWIHLTAALLVISHGMTWLAVIAAQRGKGKVDHKPAAAQAMLLAGLFSMVLYAPVLFQLLGIFDGTGVVPAQSIAWSDTGWVLAEFVRALNQAIPGGWPLISLGLLATATGIWDCLKQGVVTVGILILPVFVALVFITWFMNIIFPRFLFSSMVFFLLMTVRGGFVLSQTVLPMISKPVVLAVGLVVALATSTMVPRAWAPKQDFDTALAFVNKHRLTGDAVVCPGLTYMPLHMYLGMDCIDVRSSTELQAVEQAQARTWLLYTFPAHLQRYRPEVRRKIYDDYFLVTRISGTVGGGDIFIMLNSPETVISGS